MYIFKYAFKSITRAWGRNILIGLIVLIIAVSSCVAMSIQRASETANDEAKKDLNITAHIFVDRQYVASTVKNSSSDGSTDMKEIMSQLKGLTLDELKEYAKADSVTDFYYYSKLSLSSDEVDALNSTSSSTEETTAETDSTAETSQNAGNQNGMAPPPQQMQQQDPSQQMEAQIYKGDFMFVGFSKKDAMEEFKSGEWEMVSGEYFEFEKDDEDAGYK